MDIKDFENIVEAHSLLPGNDLYNCNALAGEVGEVANIVKKLEIFKLNPLWIADKSLTPESFREKEIDELGDVLFYLIRKIKDTGVTLEEVMWLQSQKLKQQSIKYGRTFKK